MPESEKSVFLILRARRAVRKAVYAAAERDGVSASALMERIIVSDMRERGLLPEGAELKRHPWQPKRHEAATAGAAAT